MNETFVQSPRKFFWCGQCYPITGCFFPHYTVFARFNNGISPSKTLLTLYISFVLKLLDLFSISFHSHFVVINSLFILQILLFYRFLYISISLIGTHVTKLIKFVRLSLFFLTLHWFDYFAFEYSQRFSCTIQSIVFLAFLVFRKSFLTFLIFRYFLLRWD